MTRRRKATTAPMSARRARLKAAGLLVTSSHAAHASGHQRDPNHGDMATTICRR